MVFAQECEAMSCTQGVKDNLHPPYVVSCDAGELSCTKGSETVSSCPTAPVLPVSLHHGGCGNVALACER